MSQNINPQDQFIQFARPAIGAEEEQAVLEVLRSGWLTTGKVAANFEIEFEKSLGIPHALALNSATSGLHLGLEVLGIGEGDFVISSPYTFTATVEIARYLGAHPLFVDIEEDSLNIDPALLAQTIANNDRVKCVIPVHLGGHPCDMKAICEVCESRDIPIMEDAAHAFPCTTNRGPAGTVGSLGVFSFYTTKTITTGEGGMLVTGSDELAKKAKVLRLHGIDRDVWGRYQSAKPATWEYDIVAPGFKYNMADLNAAIGLQQLKKAADFHRRRLEIAETYLNAFAEIDFIDSPERVEGHSWHLFIIGIEQNRLTLNRDEFLERLTERGIGTSVHYKPLHLMSYYRSTYGLKPEDFPRSLKRYTRSLSLPIYPTLSDEQVARVIREVIALGKSHYKAHG